MGFFKNRKLRKRLGAGLLALCMVTMTPLAVSAETVAEIQAEQDRLEAEKQELQSKLDQLRNDNAQKEYYLTDVPALIQAAGGRVKVCKAVLNEQILGVNTPDQLAETERFLRQRGEA